MRNRFAIIMVISVTSLAVLSAQPGASRGGEQPASTASGTQSTWAYIDPATHRLHYRPDERGNRIMDFSYAGYGGGGVRIPDVRVAKSVKPVEGDNTVPIQAAIDA